jgi:ABC-2 type transport system ATP-binding protein
MIGLELMDLRRSFGDREVVRGLSFSVAPGELFGFLGPNGSGKSTTIKMLITLLEPTAGDATIGGASIRDVWAVRQHIGVVFQDPSLDLRLSATENLDFYGALYRPDIPRAERRERAASAIALMGLADRADDMVRTYSWGMRRRLEIARSLLTDPGLLFLDEPTTGLDPQTRAALWAHLERLRRERGLTLFLATHDMEEAARCDRVAVLYEGALQAIGTPAALLEQTGCAGLTEAFLALTTRAVEGGPVDGPIMMKGKDSSTFRRG